MAAGTSTESTIVTVLAVSVLVLYFVPTILAFCLHHHSRKAILVVNLLSGWTVIGWAIAAVWSSTAIGQPTAPRS